MEACFHCNLPVPEGSDFPAQVSGENRHFCCPGCRAVAQTISGLGLDQYYRKRDRYAQAQQDKTPSLANSWMDSADLVHPAIEPLPEGTRIDLQLLGITCSACVWLIEQHLQQLPGVRSAQVSQTTQRARVVLDRAETPISEMVNAIESLGYQARLARDAASQQANRRESTEQLIRLGIAAIGMMQVGMYAIALHAGALQGISDLQRDLMRHATLIIATLVVFVSSRPFFHNAWHALRARRLVMDVPVALAIGLAYAASLVATFGGFGEVYFDSVVMFTFFLLLSRFLEHRARLRMDPLSLQALVPEAAERLDESGRAELVPLSSLRAGDRVRVAAGQRIPVDGIIDAGCSQLDESVLTGEFELQERTAGDAVVAGSLNGEGQITLRVSSIGKDTLLAQLDELAEQATLARNGFMGFADQWSGRFIAIVMSTALAASLVWLTIDPSRAFWIGLAVLVVACPCALSLATPTSYAAAISGLRSIGVLVRNTQVLEKLPLIDRVVFDKTGTLTEGLASIRNIVAPAHTSTGQALAIAAALERHSSHPFAKAFVQQPDDAVEAIVAHPGEGVEGWLNGDCWRIGKASFAMQDAEVAPTPGPCEAADQEVFLSRNGDLQAVFCLNDPLRPSAEPLVQELRKRHISVSLLSGDPSARVGQVAAALGIADFQGGLSAQQKLVRLYGEPDAPQTQTQRILYLGDGINDLPALGRSDISMTLANAPVLVRSRSDIGLANGDLRAVYRLLDQSLRVKRVIRQNISWALLYNFSAIPLAAMGFVPPWAAAIGMSLSSLVVVLNATRLTRVSPQSARS